MGIHKNQRGIAHIAIILVVLILAVAGGAYYYVTQADKDKDANTSQTPEEKAAESALMKACEQEVDDKDFCKYASNLSNLYGNKEAYTAVTTGSMSGEDSTSTIKSDGKGNSHMIIDMAGGKSETITLNGTMYSKTAGQSVWYRMPSSESTPDSDDSVTDEPEYDFDAEEESGPKTIYKRLAEEPCGDLTCIKYQTYSEDSPTETYTVWFDTKDHKTRKTEIVSGGSTMTTVYTYGNVTITEPSPVEDMPDYSNMTPEQLQQQLQQLGQ